MNFKEQFPVLENCTYLNTANSGILAKSIQEWRSSHDEDFMQMGSRFRISQADFLQDLRQHLARFFHSKEENVFLVQNFSIAFNTFLDGLSRSHRFLLVTSDYPSINYPVESRMFTYTYAKSNENLEQDILDTIKSFKPSVLALSLVQYTNGIKIDFDFIKRLKAEHPDLLIIADGTQFCGTEDFNFEESGLDVLISSGYKWMLGGYGNGFMLIKNHVYNYLYQEKTTHSLPKEAFLKDKKLLSLCFESGHLDTLNFGTLKQSILFLEEIGFDFIQKRLQTLSQMAKQAFTDRGLLSKEIIDRPAHSSIFSIAANAHLIKKIEDANIITSQRGAGLRISFNFYNNEQELQQLLKVIDEN
ncbi:aminotransferase class V-fold PLP-dependent enzyme [Pedobacter cryoconitis]|uniref:Selenocysteine lyase/cysteine desulfurase n=1 Tax=Pedobacter cryoconitis TaxID=188932 RepID=A0A7X0J0Y9_9SPHI|nr:aminotransferase class V-fold PLP-dependent enzyme [Pedobacter cryoconitis]MBB6499071.1 selenocysteine lyase/cysteine desulfurase [Pedobacter cryoconitis]